MHGNCICHELSCSLSVLVDILLESLVEDIHLTKPCENFVRAGVVVLGYVRLKLGNKCLCFGRIDTRANICVFESRSISGFGNN